MGIKVCIFDKLHDILPVNFDKGSVKLEYREFAVDSAVDCTETDATTFWLTVYHMKSPMDVHKYRYLAAIAMTLLSIPTSNANCE